RHLQLADSDGITSLPTTVIFEQLSLMGKEYVVSQPRSPTQSLVADDAASTCVDVRYRGATTTVTRLKVGQDNGNIDKTPTMPYDSPLLRVNTLGSDKGNMTQQELMVFCTTLSKKQESLERDLKQNKKIYRAAYTKLIKKVKKLEKTAKSSQAKRRARIVVSDDEGDLEDPSKQGRKITKIDQDPGISLQEQKRLGFEADVRLQAELDEEERVSAEVTSRRKRKYTEAEQARMLAELVNQRKRYFDAQRAEERRNKPPTQAQQRTYMSIYIKNIKGYTLQQLRGYSFDEIKTLFETTMRRVNTFV
nr:hypothetical protein [Tanacetum cinerariifolium]